MSKPGWLRKKAAGEHAGETKERTIHDWIRNRGLRHVKVGGIVLIKKEWLDTFLESFEEKGQVDRIVDEVLREDL